MTTPPRLAMRRPSADRPARAIACGETATPSPCIRLVAFETVLQSTRHQIDRLFDLLDFGRLRLIWILTRMLLHARVVFCVTPCYCGLLVPFIPAEIPFAFVIYRHFVDAAPVQTAQCSNWRSTMTGRCVPAPTCCSHRLDDRVGDGADPRCDATCRIASQVAISVGSTPVYDNSSRRCSTGDSRQPIGVISRATGILTTPGPILQQIDQFRTQSRAGSRRSTELSELLEGFGDMVGTSWQYANKCAFSTSACLRARPGWLASRPKTGGLRSSRTSNPCSPTGIRRQRR